MSDIIINGRKLMKTSFKTLFTVIITLLLTITMFLTGCAAVSQKDASAPAGTDAAQTAAILPQSEQPSYVSIDINPSIELTLSTGLVTEAKAYNEDGSAIILAANVLGLTSQQAVSSIVNEFAAQGYVASGDSSPAIVITVAGSSEEGLAQALKQNAEQSLSGLGLQADVLATDVAGEVVQTAANCGLSVGRYLVLKQIAINEGINIEEAKTRYGSLKMSELLAKVGDVDKFMGDVQQLSSFLDGLTPEQIQILSDARFAFQVAMKNAQQAFLSARAQAKSAFGTARDAAKDSFLKTKDNKALKAAKEQIKQTFADAKKNAINALKQAHINARDSFMAAVSALGIDPAVLERLIDWDLDLNFDIDLDMNIGSEDQDEDQDYDQGDEQDDQGGSDRGDQDGNNGGNHGNGGNGNEDNGKGHGDDEGDED